MITQRFAIDDCILHCAGCGARLAENVMEHPDDCPELQALAQNSRRMRDSKALRHFPRPGHRHATACGYGITEPRTQMPIVTDPAEVTCGRCQTTSAWKAADQRDIPATPGGECAS